MNKIESLDVLLYNKHIATLTNLPGDKNVLHFQEDFINDANRPVLSLSFIDDDGDFITESKPTRTRLLPFFSNLLPEGYLRTYLASQASVNEEREFYLLDALGEDLPGALKVVRSSNKGLSHPGGEFHDAEDDLKHSESTLHFSLAGVQLKFSAVQNTDGGLTIPAGGVGGDWIVKLPSAIYHQVPENEFSMMEMARLIGLNVPETALVPVESITGLPQGIGKISQNAFIIKRFDRTSEGRGIHMEDFAQVFGVYPEQKYRKASYRNIADVIMRELGAEGIIEFTRRFIFNVLIGNGDMHLKNWSLLYSDPRKASLAPAYDFVSTIPYLPEDQLALNFVDSKAFEALTYDEFERFSKKAHLPDSLVQDITRETVVDFKRVWKDAGDYPLDSHVIDTINDHLKRLPFYK